jgi:hypothetical protein
MTSVVFYMARPLKLLECRGRRSLEKAILENNKTNVSLPNSFRSCVHLEFIVLLYESSPLAIFLFCG